mmetsp:Transcript_18969/g.34372  ORF Transcript_18969/g.34372 Transcript_18969/m.34372 type:complete len:112 (-) Transcript_18969:1434-1769(-)
MKTGQALNDLKAPNVAKTSGNSRQALHFFKAALSKFLRKTQKIMKSVEPNVCIVLPAKRKHKKKGRKRTNTYSINDVVVSSHSSSNIIPCIPARQIDVPQFTDRNQQCCHF